jgi:HlyD family secretion protein
VIVELPRRPAGLGAGYRLRARFVTATRARALVVPRFSVLQDADGGFYVFVVADDRLVRRPVRIGLKNDHELEVLEGLEAGARIVATPDTTLAGGQRAKVVGVR